MKNGQGDRNDHATAGARKREINRRVIKWLRKTKKGVVTQIMTPIRHFS